MGGTGKLEFEGQIEKPRRRMDRAVVDIRAGGEAKAQIDGERVAGAHVAKITDGAGTGGWVGRVLNGTAEPKLRGGATIRGGERLSAHEGGGVAFEIGISERPSGFGGAQGICILAQFASGAGPEEVGVKILRITGEEGVGHGKGCMGIASGQRLDGLCAEIGRVERFGPREAHARDAEGDAERRELQGAPHRLIAPDNEAAGFANGDVVEALILGGLEHENTDDVIGPSLGRVA